MLASEEGSVEVVEALLSRNAQVNIQNSVRNVFVHSFISLEVLEFFSSIYLRALF